MKKLVIVGQGYVGLPIAMRGVDAGYSVVGLDVDPVRVAALAKGQSFVEDVGNAEVQRALGNGTYLPTTSLDEVKGFDYAIITVPTPLKESIPDLSFIEQSVSALGPFITPGCTVVLESTTYPGTTDDLVVPSLEHASGLVAGRISGLGTLPSESTQAIRLTHS